MSVFMIVNQKRLKTNKRSGLGCVKSRYTVYAKCQRDTIYACKSSGTSTVVGFVPKHQSRARAARGDTLRLNLPKPSTSGATSPVSFSESSSG